MRGAGVGDWPEEALLRALVRLRRAMVLMTEELIAGLDELDGDPDIERQGDDEPSLGRTETGHLGGRAWCIDGEKDDTEAA